MAAHSFRKATCISYRFVGGLSRALMFVPMITPQVLNGVVIRTLGQPGATEQVDIVGVKTVSRQFLVAKARCGGALS